MTARMSRYWKEVKDRPARTPNVVFVVALHYQMPSSYIFALSSMSFRYLRLLYDMIGGLLRIVFIRGWFSIRVEFAIHVFLRSCSAGWYVLTKGNSLSSLFCFCLGADCLSQTWPLTTTFVAKDANTKLFWNKLLLTLQEIKRISVNVCLAFLRPRFQVTISISLLSSQASLEARPPS